MAKNIIVCADGTGNKGGYSPDSNVYKVYKSIDKYYSGTTEDDFEVIEQIVFYDNGVGTATNKYLRSLGAAFGFGFEDNVRDLYKFLARNYEPGDRIYFFGFSRGASTVRACNGFIHTCGLANGKGLRNQDLDRRVKEAFDAYKEYPKDSKKAQEIRDSDYSHGVIEIQFLGVWDTVVALGFPKRTDVTGPVSFTLNLIFEVTEKLADIIFPHSFYNYKLTDNIKNAYQALAIDDERTAFWPFVWNEDNRGENTTLEQVWFAGMHSNVGGGYERSGMASVALHWMMLRAKKSGLEFEADAIPNALNDSHIHGRMYDSRHAAAVLYRYHPREIEKLCQGKIKADNIRLHSSVIERMNHRTANYAPGQLPGKFDVVESDTKTLPITRNPGKDPNWATYRKELDQWVLWRKGLYAAMLTFILLIVIAPLGLSSVSIDNMNFSGFWGYLANILSSILPDYFNSLIKFAVIDNSYLFVAATITIIIYMWLRSWFRSKTIALSEKLRNILISENNQSLEK